MRNLGRHPVGAAVLFVVVILWIIFAITTHHIIPLPF
jgi:hypothetical protein